MADGTAVVLDDRMLAHDPGRGHPERPSACACCSITSGDAARPRAARRARRDRGRDRARPRRATHRARRRDGGLPRVVFDPDTSTSPASYEAARLAAGSLLTVCEAVLAGEVAERLRARPPAGHHAERDRAMGFCLFNNVALAAAWLRGAAWAASRSSTGTSITGTARSTSSRRTRACSTCRRTSIPAIREPGPSTRSGRGAGAGRTLNLPFPPGFGDAEFARAFDEVVLPICRAFAPDFVLVSAGFDCDRRDPLGALQVSPAGIAHMARGLRALAEETAAGRIAAVLEGGYDLNAIVDGVDETLAAFRGRDRDVPLATGDARNAERVLARVREAHAPHWPDARLA
jgi:acetoin utilization deacetylase AcuC-like enzyme